MGKPIAHLGCYHVCPDQTSKKKHVGGPVVEAASSVFVGGLPVTCVGDRLICKGPPDTIVQGSASVFVEGRPVARVGDTTAHGGKIVDGNPTVLVGDQVSIGTGAAAASMAAGVPETLAAKTGQSSGPAALDQLATAATSGVSARAPGSAALTPQAYAGNQPRQPDQISGAGAEKPEDDKRVLRIGVFFDGTGNHKDNDRYLTDRDITNVAKLHDLYDADDDTYISRIYLTGVGTVDGEYGDSGFEAPEDLVGMATGIGPNGGHNRIELALSDVADRIANFKAEKVVFDVFGFSRGAALARHFVNLIQQWPQVISVPALRTRIWSNRPIIYMREIDAFPSGVEAKVAFVGLFDTVGSFYLAGNENNLDFNLDLPTKCTLKPYLLGCRSVL